MSSEASESGYSAFRISEKYFKSRSITGPARKWLRKIKADPSATYPLLQGQGVMDLSRPDIASGKEDAVRRAGWKADEDITGGRPLRKVQVTKPLTTGETSHLDGYILGDGLILIPEYLSKDEQLSLLKSSLDEYTQPPNPLNLSTHYVLPGEGDIPFFQMYVNDPEALISSIASTRAVSEQHEAEGSPTSQQSSCQKRQLIQNEPAAVEGYQTILQKVSEWKGDEPSAKLKSKTVGKLFGSELRWANLGWVYNWTNKAYDLTSETPIPFPIPLAETCRNIVRGIQWEQVFGNIDDVCGDGYEQGGRIRPDGFEGWKNDYVPDTGIVNFYQTGDTLMGHVDRSELDPYRPLISISLGHSAIFLLGGTTRQTPPVPIILRSGDVLVMAGRGRKCYHGVPRIMENTLPDYFEPCKNDDPTMAACKKFISTARININARQVFPKGFVRPDLANGMSA